MIITRYLTREVLNTLLAVTIVLVLIFLSQQLVRYLNYVAVGKIATNLLLELISFEVPYLVALLLPLGLYLGILLAYGRLYADHEMSILQMCGFGNQKLLRVTSLIVSAIAILVLFLMLWVNPWISAKRQQLMESDEATLHMILTLIPGRFQASPDGRHVMYVENLSRDRQRAENVFLAQEKKSTDSEQSAWMLVFANQGYQTQAKKTRDSFFVTTDGYRYEGVPGQNDYTITQYKKYTVRIPTNDAHTSHQEAETLSTTQLWRDYANPKHAAELQWRFSIALSTLLLGALAVPLSAVRPRRSRYMILLPAVLIYIVYVNLLFTARHWLEQSTVSTSIGMWWVHGLMLIAIILATILGSRSWAK